MTAEVKYINPLFRLEASRHGVIRPVDQALVVRGAFKVGAARIAMVLQQGPALAVRDLRRHFLRAFRQ